MRAFTRRNSNCETHGRAAENGVLDSGGVLLTCNAGSGERPQIEKGEL